MWIIQLVAMAVIQDPAFADHKFPPSRLTCYQVGTYQMQFAAKLEGNRVAVFQEDGLAKVGIIQVKTNGENPNRAGLKWLGNECRTDEWGVSSMVDKWEECLRD